MPVLFGVATGPVAVLEIETVVFDGLPLELVEHAGAHGFGQPWKGRRESENFRERSRGRREGVQRFECLLPGPLSRVGPECVGRTNEGVNGLPSDRITGIEPCKFVIGCFQTSWHYVP